MHTIVIKSTLRKILDKKINRDIIYWLLPLFILCLFTFIFQSHIYLHKDTAMVTHNAAVFMLHDQTYAKPIFDSNPPLIFYVSMPPIFLAKLIDVNLLDLLRLYIICMAIASISLSHYFFKKLFKTNNTLIYIMSFSYAFVLLVLPIDNIGQREHFLIILSTPYFFLAACRLENIPIKNWLAILIGIMAAIGFALKPFFLITLMLIELIFIVRKKNIWGWVRIESLTAVLFILSYGLSVIVLCPDFFHIVLPSFMPMYDAVRKPLSQLTLHPFFLLCCGALILPIAMKGQTKYLSLMTIFSVAIVGYLISFLIPGALWKYHLFPAEAISFLACTLGLAELFMSPTFRIRYVFVGVISAVYISLQLIVLSDQSIKFINYFHAENTTKKLIAFLQQQNSTASYDYFSMTHELFLIEFYSKMNFVGSLPYFYWEYSRALPEKYPANYQKKTSDFILNIISNDLNDKKPTYVIVDIRSSQERLNQRINYPKEYSQQNNFHQAWAKYKYLKGIGRYKIYQHI